MGSQDPGSIKDPFGSSEGPVGNSLDPFSSLRAPSRSQRVPLTCLGDRAMRSGGPVSSGSSSVLSEGHFGSSFSSEVASGPFQESPKNRVPLAPKGRPTDSGALVNWFAPTLPPTPPPPPPLENTFRRHWPPHVCFLKLSSSFENIIRYSKLAFLTASEKCGEQNFDTKYLKKKILLL